MRPEDYNAQTLKALCNPLFQTDSNFKTYSLLPDSCINIVIINIILIYEEIKIFSSLGYTHVPSLCVYIIQTEINAECYFKKLLLRI